METKVRNLTVDELKKLIAEVVRKTVEDFFEDILALSSEKYVKSIEENKGRL